MYQVAPVQFLLAFGIAFGCSILGALLAGFAWLFVLLYAPVAGTLIGKAVVRAVKGKRGIPLAVVTSLGVAAGALLPVSTLLWGGSAAAHFLSPFVWIYIAFAVSGVWYWIK